MSFQAALLYTSSKGERRIRCVWTSCLCWSLFSGFSVFTFLAVIVFCLFYGSSLLQGTHTLSAHHRQSARSHTGEFNLVVGNVCYKKYWTFCPLMLSFTFCSFKENVYRVLINIVQLAFSPKWLSTGEMLKTCIFFAYDQLLPIPCNWPLNDRTLNSSLADAREAFINVCVDAIERWKVVK